MGLAVCGEEDVTAAVRLHYLVYCVLYYVECWPNGPLLAPAECLWPPPQMISLGPIIGPFGLSKWIVKLLTNKEEGKDGCIKR